MPHPRNVGVRIRAPYSVAPDARLNKEGVFGVACGGGSVRAVGSPRELPPAAPTDPDVRISRIRLLGLRSRCDTVDAVNDSCRRQRVALQQPLESFPYHLGSG